MIRRLMLAIAGLMMLASCGGTPVFAADNNFPTPGGATAPGDVPMCLNGSNQVVPCSVANPLQVSGSLAVTPAVNTTPTDCSGTITAGGTAQNAITASATLHGFQIMNLSTTDFLWINFNGTATASTAGSYSLQPGTSTTSGGSYSTPTNFAPNTNISIVAATTGDKFSCTKF